MIWANTRAGGDLWRYLRRRGKRENRRGAQTAGRGVIPHRTDIAERPAIVAAKSRLGDWEGDTIVGAHHTGALLTHVERNSVFTTISKLTRSTATAAHRATVRRLTPLRDHVYTITSDNGKEFAGHRRTAHCLQAHIFFATPYHAWERGVNENTNGLIRDFFPKGTDFTTIHPATVAKVERLLNRRPRKSLGFHTPNEVFHALARGG
jgi:IS30 family transposase